MSTAVYPPRGTSPWDNPLRQYIDKSVDEVRNAVRSILGSMEGLTNPGALAEWHAVDPALETKRIAFIGDSITEGCLASSYTKTYPMLLQSALRTKYGINGGLGYVNAASTTDGVVPPLPVTRSGGVNEDINGGWNRGLGSHAVQVGHATTDRLTYTQPCTSVEIRYGTAWMGGQLRVLIDGVEVALLSSNAPDAASEQSGLSWTSNQLTPGNHTIDIEGANAPDFPAVFEGITFFNGDESSGVRVYNAGHYGAQAPEFASGTLAMQALNRTNPHLVVVYLGTNDLVGGTVSGFLTAIDTITSNIRPEASILLIGGYLRGDEAEKPEQVAKWQQMKAGLVDRAVGRIAYLDLQPHWDELTPDGPLSPLMVDRIHPNDAGFQRITGVLFTALQPDLLAGIIGSSDAQTAANVTSGPLTTAALNNAIGDQVADPESPAGVALTATIAAETARLQVHPLARFHAALAMRDQRPARMVTLGSSTTWGAAATSREREWTSLLLRRAQASYPNGIPGGEARPLKFSEAGTANPLPGVQLLNGGLSGTTSADYAPALTLMGIATHDPALVIHMIGSNDSVPGALYIDPAAYKTNVAGRVDAIDAQQDAAGLPLCHVLAHTFRRWQVTAAQWAEYGQALAEIADERDNVLFVDLSAQFEILDLYGTNPFGVMSSDVTHMTDAGHALMADLLARALRIEQSTPEDRRLVLTDSFTRQVAAPTAPEYPAGRTYEAVSGTYTAGGGRLAHTTGGTILVDCGLSDVDVSGVINTGDGASLAGLVFKADSDANRLGIFLNRGTQEVMLYKTDAGATTVLHSVALSIAANADYHVRVIAQGAAVVAYVNGVQRLTFTLTGDDPTQYANYTKVGFRCGAPTANLHYRGLAARRL